MSVVINNSRVTVFYFSIPLLSPFMAHISVFLLTAGVLVVIKDKVLTSSQRAFFLNRGGVPDRRRVIFSTIFMLCLRGFKRIFY